MVVILKQFLSLVRLLHSETGTRSLASGAAAGWVLGLSPGFSIQTILVWLLILCFRIQAGMAGICALGVALLATPLDPLFDRVGVVLLSSEGLRPLWTSLYHLPLIPLTRFNDSVVMGSGVVALVCAPGVYWLAQKLVLQYRTRVVAVVAASRLWKWFSATRLVQWYLSYEQYNA